jgi:hypothetical protein
VGVSGVTREVAVEGCDEKEEKRGPKLFKWDHIEVVRN